jgi:hypothetical protein
VLASVTFQFDATGTPRAVNFAFRQADVRIHDPDFAAELWARAEGPDAHGTDHDIRRWVGQADYDVAHPEKDGEMYRVWFSDNRSMLVYPKAAELGDLSVDTWITGRLRLRRTH